jgi:PAS domain S-box-containing protein
MDLERLAPILDALEDAVTIRGADDRILFANRAALERMGFHSAEQMTEADPRELMGPYRTYAEDGTEIGFDQLPSVRLLRGEREPEPLLMRTVSTAGEEHWVLLKAAALGESEDGRPLAAVTIIEDVTVAKRAALRTEFLVRAGQVLASSLDYEQTLRNVAGLAVPRIADWCAVDLFEQDGGRVPVAVAHIDPAKVEMAGELRAYQPDELDPEQGLGRVRDTGEPALYNDIPDELLVAAALDEEHLRLLRAVGMRAALILPMRAAGRTIGAITLVNAESGRTFDPGDVEFAEQIADRAALAVENARLYRSRVEVARTLQSSLLPEALPEIPGWEIAAFYRSAGEESDVGGDFYDFWRVGGDWLMVIGDVTGKGVGAAAVTSLVRHTAWAASDFDPRPSEILARIDAALKRRSSFPVCTTLCLRVAGATGTVACGGHPPLLHVGEHGVSELGAYGTLLGGFPKVAWPEVSFELQPGDTLVAITDGVTDTLGPGEERFGQERLGALLAENRSQAPGAIRERLIDALAGFQVGPAADDTAVVIMRFTGVAARAGEPVGAQTLQTGNGAR